jgi:hypothetical protein
MTHIATLGTSSCATIAIGGFKEPNKEKNDAYIDNTKTFKDDAVGMSVKEFSDKVLYPVSQPLGRTKDYPLEQLMQELERSALAGKLIIATLNQNQYMGNNLYWHKQLKKWGFKLFTKTNNNWGSVNYMYIRNPSEVALTEEEKAS